MSKWCVYTSFGRRLRRRNAMNRRKTSLNVGTGPCSETTSAAAIRLCSSGQCRDRPVNRISLRETRPVCAVEYVSTRWPATAKPDSSLSATRAIPERTGGVSEMMSAISMARSLPATVGRRKTRGVGVSRSAHRYGAQQITMTNPPHDDSRLSARRHPRKACNMEQAYWPRRPSCRRP